jgi:lysophospholipase
MRKISTFTLLLFLSITSYSLEESKVFDHIVKSFKDKKSCPKDSNKKFWTLRYINSPIGQTPASFKDKKYYKLRYSRFGCELGSKGSLVISPGRGEASIFYYETAIDFIKLGYSPVYVVDHRGQGFSPRLLTDHSKGHIGSFEDYINDLDAMVQDVIINLNEEFGRKDEPLFYTSNSMGGAIGIGYFQKKGKENPFTAGTLHGSQIVVNYLSFIDPSESLTQRALRSLIKLGDEHQAEIVNLVAGHRCRNGKAEDYASRGSFGGYKKGKRKFKANTEVIMTHSEARYNLGTYFRDKVDWSPLVKSHYTNTKGVVENWSGVHIGGSTNQWTKETSGFNDLMRTKTEIKKMIIMPLLIAMGERDLRAYREYGLVRTFLRKLSGKKAVDLYHHKKFCDDLNRISQSENNKNICTFEVLDEGFHELYQESDKWRNKAIQLADQHFQNAVKHLN